MVCNRTVLAEVMIATHSEIWRYCQSTSRVQAFKYYRISECQVGAGRGSQGPAYTDLAHEGPQGRLCRVP